jgi:hypothetical protein
MDPEAEMRYTRVVKTQLEWIRIITKGPQSGTRHSYTVVALIKNMLLTKDTIEEFSQSARTP